ncbi:hypothetical protein EDB84DRAFT_1440661 [Lactarius hengduanensis]|nr:hypothetical protein EDB84DRAFT_1440661 [Lactarius hengduanensis]
MSQSTRHIDFSSYTHPLFPTNRTLFLSGSPVFEDSGWCTTTTETANGRGTCWVRGLDDIQWGTDKCVVFAPLRFQEGDYIRLPSLGRSQADFIRGHHSDLQHARCTSGGDSDLSSERQWLIWSSDALTDYFIFSSMFGNTKNITVYGHAAAEPIMPRSAPQNVVGALHLKVLK